jgi:hypothetical protein
MMGDEDSGGPDAGSCRFASDAGAQQRRGVRQESSAIDFRLRIPALAQMVESHGECARIADRNAIARNPTRWNCP